MEEEKRLIEEEKQKTKNPKATKTGK